MIEKELIELSEEIKEVARELQKCTDDAQEIMMNASVYLNIFLKKIKEEGGHSYNTEFANFEQIHGEKLTQVLSGVAQKFLTIDYLSRKYACKILLPRLSDHKHSVRSFIAIMLHLSENSHESFFSAFLDNLKENISKIANEHVAELIQIEDEKKC